MRRQLNLNKYYEGLELEDVNELFSRMLDLKTNIDGLDYVYNESKERFDQTENWLRARAIGESGVRYQVKKIDKLMRDRQKETIFGTTEDKKFAEEDYRSIIEKYRYLMSEPEKDKEEQSQSDDLTK